ncbi:hypothetical protein F2P81_009902 [Scophthalmus maximus]|uniref:Ion transport domain-containing protein n=1 Tax=Scophthalmus maximus TaxID=52904 RepID=A0A6A4SY36_SCOMX|nr:hypothetical protein F2P81_009902 [Scophthalmus maximus]
MDESKRTMIMSCGPEIFNDVVNINLSVQWQKREVAHGYETFLSTKAKKSIIEQKQLTTVRLEKKRSTPPPTILIKPRLFSLTHDVSTWFERVSMMVILLNCVTLGMYQPCENIDCSSDRCQILQAFDAFIYIFFALEMVIKMVALGIFGRRSYLGDTWNRLDFFIVMAG